MTIQDFVQAGWRDHGDDAEGVFARLPEGLALVEEPGHAAMLAGLVVHVAGEHLGRWEEGLELLDRLLATEAGRGARAGLLRQKAVLQHCAGREADCAALLAEGRDPERPAASSEVRVFAIAASALAGQGRTAEAIAAFRRTLAAAEYGPGADDPAARSLAITANNLACELEEKADRSEDESELLRAAARAARRYWEIAGDWTNVKIAEYRLARTHLALGEPATALEHATAALALCDANQGGPADRFFPHEATARARLASGDDAGAKAARDEAAACLEGVEDEGFRAYCSGELEKLDELLAGG